MIIYNYWIKTFHIHVYFIYIKKSQKGAWSGIRRFIETSLYNSGVFSGNYDERCWFGTRKGTYCSHFQKKIQKQTMQYVTIKKFSRGENNFQINLLSLPEKIQIILFVSFFFSYIVYLIIPYLI